MQRGVESEDRGEAHRAIGAVEQLLQTGAALGPRSCAQVLAVDRHRVEHDERYSKAGGVGAMRRAGDHERADANEAAHPSIAERLKAGELAIQHGADRELRERGVDARDDGGGCGRDG
jgi:hypothetical protein